MTELVSPSLPGPVALLSRHERLQRSAAVNERVISFAGGLPNPALFPRSALIRALHQALSDPSCPALQYGWPEGSAVLRNFVARALAARGAAIDSDQVLITSGAQQALGIALQATIRKNDAVGIEPETYPGALEALRVAKAELVSLEAAARAYYVMPSISNPRGLPLDPAVRHALLHRVRKQRAIVIEDDAYGETAFVGTPGRPLLADLPDRTFHVGTFSKTLAPGLRVGWLIAPKQFMRDVLAVKQTQDLQANTLAQAALERYLSGERYSRQLHKLRANYRRRARRLARSLALHLPDFRFQAPAGGFSIWLESPLSVDDEAFFETALRHGVTFDSGRPFRWQSQQRGLALRVCYSTVAEDDIETGVLRLARAWAEMTARAREAPTPIAR
ncbi:MAG TPA: PLP-dependent aminotransferase family protein [Polyangiaceae bacterium]|nr:PLP-dependent aminotransferase family protein [Polyangiaceae bacterium]